MDARDTALSWGTMIRAAIIVVLLIGAYLIRDIILVVLTAVVIASALEPATLRLIRFRVPRVFAVLFLYVAVFSFFIVVFYFFLPPLLNDLSGFVSAAPEYFQAFNVSLGNQLATNQSLSSFSTFATEPSSTQSVLSNVRNILNGVSNGVIQSLSFVFGGLLGVILIVVISFYLAVQERGIENFLRIVSPLRYEEYIVNLWERTQKKIGLWMQGQLVLGLLMGVFTYLGLAILGVPYALFLAVLAAMFELIPLFGPILAAVPAVALAFGQGGVALGVTVIGFYLILQQFENHLIYPLVVRKVIGVPPLLVILSLIIFGDLFGFLGIILAVPLVTLLLEVADDIQKNKREVVRKKSNEALQ